MSVVLYSFLGGIMKLSSLRSDTLGVLRRQETQNTEIPILQVTVVLDCVFFDLEAYQKGRILFVLTNIVNSDIQLLHVSIELHRAFLIF